MALNLDPSINQKSEKCKPAFFGHLCGRDSIDETIAPHNDRFNINKNDPLMMLLLGRNFQYMWTTQLGDKIRQGLTRLKATTRANYIFAIK